MLLAVLPILIAAARAVFTRWAPIQDNAYFTARSLDVGTSNHPLLGAWSSGSTEFEGQINNLGPLQLDLLAPFTKISPLPGTAIAVAVVHVSAVLCIAWLVRRLGGDRVVLPAMVGVATLTWTMGSEMLITPQQHQFLVLPYLVVLVAGWACAAGDRWASVPLVFYASLATQTHLSYVVLVALITVPAVAGQVLAARSDVRRFIRPWIVSAVLAVVLWFQTGLDQFFGTGNVSSLASSSGDSAAPGFGTGLRLTSGALISVRTHLRPGFSAYDPAVDRGGALQVGLLILLLVAAGVVIALPLPVSRSLRLPVSLRS